MKKVYKVHIIFPKNLVVLHHDWKNDNKNGVSSVFNNNKWSLKNFLSLRDIIINFFLKKKAIIKFLEVIVEYKRLLC